MTRLQFIRSAIFAAIAAITGVFRAKPANIFDEPNRRLAIGRERLRKTHAQLVQDFIDKFCASPSCWSKKGKIITQGFRCGWRGIGAQFTFHTYNDVPVIARSAVLLRDDWTEGKKCRVVLEWTEDTLNCRHAVWGDYPLMGSEWNRAEAEKLGFVYDFDPETIIIPNRAASRGSAPSCELWKEEV